MPHNDLATVRVSNIPHDLEKGKLLHFFETNKVKGTLSHISLCPSTFTKDTPLTATVTFKSGSEAKKALDLTGRALCHRNVSIERDFMGLTVLAAPENPMVE